MSRAKELAQEFGFEAQRGLISSDKAIRRKSKEQFHARLYVGAFKLYFDAVSVAERKLKWLGFSSRHVVTLMF